MPTGKLEEAAPMDAKRVRRIVRRWMFPTEGGSYMGGLELSGFYDPPHPIGPV